ncbi:MAG: hypothetical protein U1C53_02120 [Candidatus Veblenbacteria bacterium]|nr:hypothetical protein [Candidatus Veblenbacteria bacterium]
MSPVRTAQLSGLSSPAPRAPRSPWPLAVTLIVVVLLLGWWFLLRPQWQTLRALPELDGFASSRAAVEAELSKLKQLTEDYTALTATDRKRLDLALPQGQDIPNLLAQLEGIAETTGFAITDLGFASGNQAGEGVPVRDEVGNITSPLSPGANVETMVQELRVNMVIEGGEYGALKEFIAAAQESIRLLNLSSVTFTTKSAGSGEVSYTLNFHTVFLPS